MIKITRKSEVWARVDTCLNKYYSEGLNACVAEVYTSLLSNKIKFPLLEYSANEFYLHLKSKDQLIFLDKIHTYKTIGGNVFLGIILQKRLTHHFKQSIHKATNYISTADAWYVCDIIGERVWGYALLKDPVKTIPELQKLSSYPVPWVIRSLGAGIHYAIKKGLERQYVFILFELLLTMSITTNKEIKQGVGWAAKTTARFHSEIIKKYKLQIQNHLEIPEWFRTKIKIGLDRSRYKKNKPKNQMKP